MSTILTDDERPELPPTNTVPRDYFTTEQMEAYADAREAAVLAKLAQQEPVAWRYKKEGGGWFVSDNEPQYVEQWNDIEEVQPLYTHPAPQQADRQRVPAEPTEAMLIAARDWSLKKYGKAIGDDAAKGCFSAMLAAAPEAPAQEKSNG